MFWKGFHPAPFALAALITLAGCSHYPFKYEPYNKPQAYASWSEVESTVKRLESYADGCRPKHVLEGSCSTFAEEYKHTMARIDATEFRLAPSHIRRLENMYSLYQEAQ